MAGPGVQMCCINTHGTTIQSLQMEIFADFSVFRLICIFALGHSGPRWAVDNTDKTEHILYNTHHEHCLNDTLITS